MLIFTDNTVTVGWIVGKIRPPQWAATFIVKGTYRLRPNEPAVPAEEPESLAGDVHWDDDPTRSLYYPSDFAAQKPRADVLLVGAAHAPGGRPVRELPVRLGIGAFSKTLRVVGNRTWKRRFLVGTSVSEPEPFVTAPLAYEHAFGGPGYGKNPVGRGRDAEQAPNVEDPLRPPSGPSSAAEPAGFGPLACTWDQRGSLLGTYGEKWLKERWPWFPDDFDPGYFNAAPRDQQLDGFLHGDEAVLLENLHPEYAVYCSVLPALRARCFVNERAPAGGMVFREVPLQLDTLWIDASAEKLVLIWRGQLDVRSFKIKEIEEVYAGTEPLAEPPQSADHYRQRMEELQADKEDPEEKAVEAEQAARDAAFDQEITALHLHFAALDREHEQMEADAREEEAKLLAAHQERLIGEGIDSQRLDGGVLPDLPAAGPALAAGFDELRANAPQQLAQAEAMAAEMAEFNRVEQEMDEFDKEFPEDESPLTRQSVLEMVQRGEGLAGCSLIALDLAGLDLSGVDLSGAILLGSSLAGAKLGAANLAGADLRKVDLTGADLSRAWLDDADLSDAILAGSTLTGASLTDATLAKLDLRGLDFSGATGKGVNFSGANLEGAKFLNAKLPQGNFQRANLQEASFPGAELSAAQFEEARGHGIDLEGADITGLHASEGCDFTAGKFQRVKGTGAVFEQAVLDRADFSRAQLRGAQFGEASLREAILDRADLSYSSFDDADLRKATLTNANFLRAGFDRANLTEASLRGSNLYEAGFWDTVVDRTDFQAANLKGTTLG
jgi:uncharacterized protein YjbI with pentapeptide repeats